MDNNESSPQTSSGATPASNPPDEGSPQEAQTHQGGPTGLSAVSDSVALLDGVATAYDGFNPSIHATDAAGQPVMKKGGGYARKRGRPAGSTGTASPTPAPGTVASTPGTAKMSNDMAAKIICQNTEAFCMAVFGGEWEVTEPGEMKNMHSGIKSYLESTGGIDISPGWGLVFTMGGYAVPRLKLPETRSRLSRAFSWMKSKLKRGQ